MKFIKQFFLIVLFSLIGEVLNYLIPLPIPASIYGLVLMFFALHFKICPISAVKETGDFLLGIMPIFFISPAIALLANIEVLKFHWLFFLILGFFSTVVVMVASGWATQLIIRLSNRKKKAGNSADSAVFPEGEE